MSSMAEERTPPPLEDRAKPFEYVRPIRPVRFPVQAEVPETQRHLELRTALYQLLSFTLENQASVGSDQFLYYDASDPRQCLAPDVFVKLGGGAEEITSWKVWERGTPELAIEVISRSDAADEPWEQKLRRYHRLGIRELVRFEQDAPQPIRIWDYVEGDLVERHVEPGSNPRCSPLELYWTLSRHERWGRMLRLARDPQGHNLIPTERELHAEAQQREAEAQQREAEAQQRIHELEAELERAKASRDPQ